MSDATVTVEDEVIADADVSPAEAEHADRVERDPRMVPVTESVRYRRRAQAAERELGDLRTKFDQVRLELDQTRRQLDDAERRRRIDALLTEADAIDLDAARLLTEAAVESMDDTDVEQAVEELRRSKPYLFRRSAGGPGGAMSPKHRTGIRHEAHHAAEAAAATGNRRDLLRYLRMRRTRS